MRMLIREYVASLREEGELDLLLRDLLFIKKIVPLTISIKGAKQYGVDIEAVGLEENVRKLIIVTVKRGKITSSVWNGSKNAVRQSLDQILETHLRLLPKRLKKLPCKIVVATNGDMAQTVDVDWKSYQEYHAKEGLEFDFWGLSQISDLLDENIVTHAMFTEKEMGLFRKSLALIEESTYNLSHIYELLEIVFYSKKKLTIRLFIKKMRMLNLLQGILHQWCKTANNIKNSYLISERIFLTVVDYLNKNLLFDKPYVAKELNRIISKRIEIGFDYFEKMEPHLKAPYGISKYSYNIDFEYANNVIKLLGQLAQIGLEHLFLLNSTRIKNATWETIRQKIIRIIDGIIALYKNNPAASRPNYDDQLIDISIVLELFYKTNNFEPGIKYLRSTIEGIIDNYRFNRNFFPLFRKDYDSLMKISAGIETGDVKSSHLLIVLVEWALAYGYLDFYSILRSFYIQHLNHLNLQIWFPDTETFKDYYTKNIMHGNGYVLTSIDLPEDFREYRLRIIEQMKLTQIEETTQLNILHPIISSMAARHHRNIPIPITWRMFLINFEHEDRT